MSPLQQAVRRAAGLRARTQLEQYSWRRALLWGMGEPAYDQAGVPWAGFLTYVAWASSSPNTVFSSL